jgi:hypothetical protein
MGVRDGLRMMLFASSVLAASHASAWAQDASSAEPASSSGDPAVEFSITEHGAVRFTPSDDAPSAGDPQRLELRLSASRGALDVSVAQRASLGANADGDLARHGQGSELRVGRGLVGQRGRRDREAVYMFVASDNEALTWQPGAGAGPAAALALESRVEIGDVSAGVTYAHNGVEASLAYVERDAATRVGRQSFSQDESFAGVTVTMRH